MRKSGSLFSRPFFVVRRAALLGKKSKFLLSSSSAIFTSDWERKLRCSHVIILSIFILLNLQLFNDKESRIVPVILALSNLAFVKSASAKLALVKSAFVKSASVRFASARFALVKLAF